MMQSGYKETKPTNVSNESPGVFNRNLSQDESTNKNDDDYVLDIRHSVVSLNPSIFNSLTTTSNKSDTLIK